MSQTKHYQPIGFNTRLHDAYIKSGLEVTEISKKDRYKSFHYLRDPILRTDS